MTVWSRMLWRETFKCSVHLILLMMLILLQDRKMQVKKSATPIAEEEEPESNIDLAISNFHREYEEISIIGLASKKTKIIGWLGCSQQGCSAAFNKVGSVHIKLNVAGGSSSEIIGAGRGSSETKGASKGAGR